METDLCTVPYGRPSLSSESDEAVNEEYLYCDLSIPLEGQIDVAVPSEVVTETVVSTTMPNMSIGKRKQRQKKVVAAPSAAAIHDDLFNCTDVSVEIESNSDSQKFSLCDVLKRLSGESHLLPPSKAEREATKKMRDCLKKREMRQNPAYRKMECEKARKRMANKRQDNPNYRDNERRRDREQRATARLDKEKRQRERERDRISKKAQRDMYKNNLVPVTKCDYVTLYAYSLGSRSVPAALGSVEGSSVTVCEAGSHPGSIAAYSSAELLINGPVTTDKESIGGKESDTRPQCDKEVTDTSGEGIGVVQNVDESNVDESLVAQCDININTFESEYTFKS